MVDGISDPPARGFISYRRDDNDQFGQVVDELTKTLSGVFEARTGRALKLFVDRESIGWGENWRDKIETSVRQATFFIPIVTMRYFSSQACMDELSAFEAAARNLGVTDLILPIVLFGSDQITEDDDRPEVRLIANLNYRSIETAWEAGYNSTEWRTFINSRAKELAAYVVAAESALLASEVGEAASLAGPEGLGGNSDASWDGAGSDIYDLTARLQRVNELVTEAGLVLNGLAESANQVDLEGMDALSPGQQNARMLAAARDFAEPSKLLESVGRDTEREVRDLDPLLRAWVAEARSITLPAAVEQTAPLLQALSGIDDLSESVSQINELMQSIQFASLMNIGMRKSLRPAVNGLRSLLTAIRVYESWRNLGS